MFVLSLLPFALRVYGYLYMLPVAFVIYPLLVMCIRLIIRAGGAPGGIEPDSATVATILKVVMAVGLVAFLLAGI